MPFGKDQIRDVKVLSGRGKLLRVLPHNGIVAELGVDEGNFSRRILELTEPRTLHLVDLWGSDRFNREKERQVRTRFQAEIETGQVVVHQGDSLTHLGGFDDGYLDWVYIDTSHRYELTLAELELSRIKVKPGGIIAGHDFCKGTTPHGDEYGVVQAVHAFCHEHGWAMIYLTLEEHMHWSFALRELTGESDAASSG